MTNVLNILCESRILDANDTQFAAEGTTALVISIAFTLLLFVGIAFLIYWLATTTLGRNALEYTHPRRNAMAFYIPLIPFGIWIFLSGIAASILDRFEKVLVGWEEQLLTLCFTSIIALVLIIISVIIVKQYFVRGFKGFGLDLRTIKHDFAGAVVKLMAVWPLVLGMILLTLAIGRLIVGPDFEIEKHEELEVLIKYHQWPVRLAVIFLAVVLAPLTEEMLFRGLFQTMFRNLTRGPWVAIILASGLFAMAHPNTEHWPALFALAIALGYAYEKSGSLLQPIFMHAIFNGAMVAATLLQPS
jgi:membrane protease YdiL (CAAX protease family)